jgi:hypothetical protein
MKKVKSTNTPAHAFERLLGLVPKTVGLRTQCSTVDVAYNLTRQIDRQVDHG